MHRTAASLALALALLVVPATRASAAAEGATIDKTGWWNRANQPASTPAGPVAVPPPPGVPAGDLTVGRLGDEPTAWAAVGIQPDEGPGAEIESFTLTLVEDPEASGNREPEDAVILACPIVSFWAGGENGAWETRPEADCAAAEVLGERDDEGRWTFDLAPVGELWFDPFGTIRADGVALVPDLGAEGSTSYQVVWLGGDAIEVDLQATPAPEEDDAFASPGTPSDPPSDVGLSSGPSGGGSSLFSPPRVSTSPVLPPPPPADIPAVGGDEPAAEEATDGDDEVAGAPTAATDRRTRAGDLVGNWPPLGWLLVPVLLAVLLATSYWLGPNGQPATIDRRGGVSRALAARTSSQER